MSEDARQIQEALIGKGFPCEVAWRTEVNSTGDGGVCGFFSPQLEGKIVTTHDGRTFTHSGWLGWSPEDGTAFVDEIKSIADAT